MEDSILKLEKLKECVELEKEIKDICRFYRDNIDICKNLKEGTHNNLTGAYFHTDTETNRFLEMCSLIWGLIHKNKSISKDLKEAGELSIHKEDNVVHVKRNSDNVSGARVWIIAFKGDKSYVIPLEEESTGRYILKNNVPVYTHSVMHARWENQGRILRGVRLVPSTRVAKGEGNRRGKDIDIVKKEAEKRAIISVNDLIGLYFNEEDREKVENIFRKIASDEGDFKLFETKDRMMLVNIETAKRNEELKSKLREKILEKIKEVYPLEKIPSPELSFEEIKDIVNKALGIGVEEDQAIKLFKIILGNEDNIEIKDKEKIVIYTITKDDWLELRGN